MSEIPIPRREEGQTHRCICVIIHPVPSGTHLNRCANDVESPDSPYCDNCEARHPTEDAEVTNIYELKESKWLNSLQNDST